MLAASPGADAFCAQTRQPEGTARRTPPERRKGGADPASPLPLFTRQPLSLDRSRTSSSQA